MQFAFIAPKAHLEILDGRSDIHFALGHIAREDRNYRLYFRRKSMEGRPVMLDNGVWELGEPMPINEYLEIISDILPSEVYSPDFPGNPKKTVAEVDRFAMTLRQSKIYRKGGERIKIVGCVQGTCLEDWVECYEKLEANPNVDVIAVPVLLLNNFAIDVPEKLRWGTTRLRLMQAIQQEYGFKKTIHLTGMDYPYEMAAPVYRDPFVRSNDSKSPIVAARVGHKLTMDGSRWPGKPSSKGYFDWVMSDKELRRATSNMDVIREYVKPK